MMLVTPLIDGMNLVAKEYVTVQHAREGSGSMVLSEFAGAASELARPSPATPSTWRACRCGSSMRSGSPPAIRRAAITAMARHVAAHDVHRWVSGQLRTSRQQHDRVGRRRGPAPGGAAPGPSESHSASISVVVVTDRPDYVEPPVPAFLFDLDGTLIDSVYQNVIAWRNALAKLDIDLSVWRIHRRIGMSGGLFVSALLRETGRSLSEQDIECLQQDHAAEYLAQVDSVRPLPGARSCWPR